MKTLYIILLMLLVLVSFAYAAPKTAQIGGTIVIATPKFPYIDVDDVMKVHVHIHNSTNGLLVTNKTASCLLHIYNQSAHILEESMPFDSNGVDFELDITNYINKTGIYTSLLYCNTSGGGGFVSDSFEVTTHGMDDTISDTSTSVGIALFLLFINIAIFALPFVMRFQDEIKQWIMKQAFFMLGLAVLAFNSTVFATLAANTHLGVTSELFMFQWIFLRAVYVLMIMIFFNMIIAVPKMLRIKKQRDRMGNDEA